MTHSSSLHEILYCSTLAEQAPIRVVADIAGKARSANPQRGITGLLIFDGQNFCQQLEGDASVLTALMERICGDPRHTDITVLHQGPLASRRFKHFSLGYTPVEDVEALERLQRLRGESAVEAFVGLLQSLDLEA
ncbi:MAG: BLUF domain-containing protein [Polaromonas sp.]